MATKNKAKKETVQVEQETASSAISVEPRKSMIEKMAPLMMILMLVMAFGLGMLWSRVKYLESGGVGVPAPAAGTAAGNSKYKNFGEAMSAYAKELKLDERKMSACLNGGDKSELVEKDFQEGTALGVQGTPGFFINGRFLPGAFPYESFKEIIDKELAGTATTVLADYSQTLQQSGFVPTPKQVSVGNAPAKGNGSVTIVEYSDFQCPFCSRAKPTIDQVLKDYSGKVTFAYKHFPLDQIHPNARKASEATECARDQGKFWEMHDLLFAKQTEWSNLPGS